MIQHHFAQESMAAELFDNTKTFHEFKTKLMAVAQLLPVSKPLRWGRLLDPKDNENKILGDGFELLAELFVGEFGTHPHVGLSDYVPINPDEDYGVDALANNINGEPSAVQVKFLANALFEFSPTNSNLPSFINEAVFTLKGVDWTEVPKVKRLFLITSGKGINWVGQKKWGDRIHVIGIKGIEQLVDGNSIFWGKCVELLKGK